MNRFLGLWEHSFYLHKWTYHQHNHIDVSFLELGEYRLQVLCVDQARFFLSQITFSDVDTRSSNEGECLTLGVIVKEESAFLISLSRASIMRCFSSEEDLSIRSLKLSKILDMLVMTSPESIRCKNHTKRVTIRDNKREISLTDQS